MAIDEIFKAAGTQEQALEYLESVRWSGVPCCPYCESRQVGRHASSDRGHARWQCRQCGRAFSATVGTIFQGTHVPLRNWFLLLALMLGPQNSQNASQLARDLGMRRATVWSMMKRVNSVMASESSQKNLLLALAGPDKSAPQERASL